MCRPAPVALKAFEDDRARYGNRVSNSGIVGDQAHSTRKSDHNCGNPGYEPGYAHALDTHVDSDALGYEIRDARLRDPRVKYVIFKARLYYPDGTVKANSGHPNHVHTSFKAGTTFDTRPFYAGDDDVTPEQMAQIGKWIKEAELRIIKETHQKASADRKAIMDRLKAVEAKV